MVLGSSHGHHPSGPRPLKDRTDAAGSSGVRVQSVSTRILGIGIVLVGVLVLAVGLIMGLEFPNYVHEQNKDKLCVVYEGHDKFQLWSRGSQWNRKVYMYYWTLANTDDFVYRGQTPQFVQRGPYVYMETVSKYNVSFAATEVTYRQMRRHVFDKEATEMACATCRVQDVLTVVSPWYLQTVGQHGGEEALSWIHIPTYTSTYLKAAGLMSRMTRGRIFNQNLTVLGNFVSAPSTAVTLPLSNFSFGTWLRFSTHDYKSVIEERRGGKSFTLSEMRSLYRILTNVTLLGGIALSQPDISLQQKCKQWARGLCTSVPPRLQLRLGISECGVIYIFHQCQNSLSSQTGTILQNAFCEPNDTNACFNLKGLSDELLLAYNNAFADFLWHISSIVLHSFLASRDLSLVVSGNQSQLALGYDISASDVFKEFRLLGLLESKWIGETRETHPQWKVYTCLESRNINNNMKVKEFNNSWSSPNGLLRGTHKASLTSYTDFVSQCALATCRPCTSPSSTLSFFIEDLLRVTHFMLNCSSSIRGVKVFRYEMHVNTFGKSSKLKVADGFQNMTDVVGYLSWASLPHMAGSVVAHLNVNKSVAPSSSYIIIEPVTGRVWKRNIKLQWNIGVSQESARVMGRNISVTELPLPVFWTERVAILSDDEVHAHKHLITRLMAVSCGGIISFSVIAIVIVIVGVIVCAYPFKPNRVLPSAEESNSVSNGRYL